jgi:2-C-methyl-D-erythritol 4-phosphate cytidylyltransferase/2-C-methyl-D-erythritol 2,4-cyclodiphosphate synthase
VAVITAIILAGGKSSRFSKSVPNKKPGASRCGIQNHAKATHKLLMPVLGKPLIYYAIMAFNDHPRIGRLVVAVSRRLMPKIRGIVKKYHFNKVQMIVEGGKERQDSLLNGLSALEKTFGKNTIKHDLVIVHNAANPLVSAEEITKVIGAAQKHGAAAVGSKIYDTIKELKKGGRAAFYDREKLIALQTPQAAKYNLLARAFKKATANHHVFTDESSLLEYYGARVAHVPASAANFKVTTWHDYERVKMLMGDLPQNWLVGIGQDSHAFSATQKGLFLGGILIKNQPKLEADSDGDVVLHALYNAIAQAFGAGSLGRMATPMLKEKGINDSGKYLESLLAMVAKKGCSLNNIGLMLEAKVPAIDPLVPKIKKSISTLTGLPVNRIGVTATSGDGLTSFGRGEGIQCFAIVSLKKNEH